MRAAWWGKVMPGVQTSVRPRGERRTIALTLDACGGDGGSEFDGEVCDVLREHEVPATLFLGETWVRANATAFEELLAEPLFQIENHGSRHVPLSVSPRLDYYGETTESPEEVVAEISATRSLLAAKGVTSSWFRAGGGLYDEASVAIAAELGVAIAGYEVWADQPGLGATVISDRLCSTTSGGIALAHLNRPKGPTAAALRLALPRLREADTELVRLGDGAALG
jgi:peptidoglycan/xylan/chitin deacetylase (PgdA/CDA1 family)